MCQEQRALHVVTKCIYIEYIKRHNEPTVISDKENYLGETLIFSTLLRVHSSQLLTLLLNQSVHLEEGSIKTNHLKVNLTSIIIYAFVMLFYCTGLLALLQLRAFVGLRFDMSFIKQILID